MPAPRPRPFTSSSATIRDAGALRSVQHDDGARPIAVRTRTAAAVCIVCVLFVAAAAALQGAPRAADSADGAPAAYVQFERDGFRYSFDALSGRARLTRTDDPDTDLSALHADLAAVLRRALESKLRMSLEELTEHHAPTADALRRLGYL